MADGYDIHLDQERAEKLEKVAREAGVPTAEYALMILDQALDNDWAYTLAGFAEYDRTGEYVSAEQAMVELRAGVDADLRARGK